jgi:hypothetical protein
VTERGDIQAIIAKRTQGWLPRDDWGPRCAGCGAEEYRIDGYCSSECRDYHDDDDIRVLAKWIADLEAENAMHIRARKHLYELAEKKHVRAEAAEYERDELRDALSKVAAVAGQTADALARMAAEERWEAALTQHGVPLNELRAALERTGK